MWVYIKFSCSLNVKYHKRKEMKPLSLHQKYIQGYKVERLVLYISIAEGFHSKTVYFFFLTFYENLISQPSWLPCIVCLKQPIFVQYHTTKFSFLLCNFSLFSLNEWIRKIEKKEATKHFLLTTLAFINGPNKEQ